MKRSKIAIERSSPCDELRLEFGVLPSPEPATVPGGRRLRLELLHEEHGSSAELPTYARVFRGRVGQNEWWVPVAVKLQRDAALSGEERDAVVAKFNSERIIHIDQIQNEVAEADLDRLPIVRQLDIWPEGHEAGTLKPCIVCEHARHALKPRCVKEDEVLTFEDWGQDVADPMLKCQGCGSQYSHNATNQRQILEATVQKDPACEDCKNRHGSKEVCLASASFLSFFPSRILLYDLLDLDLHDFLTWRKHKPPDTGRDHARRRFAEYHTPAENGKTKGETNGTTSSELRRLREVAALFSQTLEAIEFLHRKGIAHIDLKPHNICLKIRGSEIDVKVIDLGLAEDPKLVEYLRDAKGLPALRTDFAAPEVHKPRVHLPGVHYRCAADHCLLIFEPKPLGQMNPEDPLFCPGDQAELKPDENTRIKLKIVAARETGTTLEVDAIVLGTSHERQGDASIVLDKQLGPAADVFSLGMILLCLLADETELESYRKELAGLVRILLPRSEDLRRTSVRKLLRGLRKSRNNEMPNFCQLIDRLSSNESIAGLAYDLLGIVLRCTLRLPNFANGESENEPFTYVAHRGDDAGTGLQRLRRDLDAVCADLRPDEAAKASLTDIADFEKNRLQAVRLELEEARPRRDLTTLDRLERELQGRWRVQQPPPGLLAEISRAKSEVVHDQQLSQIDDLADELKKCFEQRQFDRVRGELLPRWDELVKALQGKPSRTARGMVRTILEWRAKEKREELEKKRKAKEQARRILFTWVVGAVIVLAVTALAWYRSVSQRSEQEFAAALQTIKDYLDHDQLDDAAQFAKTQPDATMARAQMAEQKERLGRLLKREEERGASFAKLLGAFEADRTDLEEPEVVGHLRKVTKKPDELVKLNRALDERHERLRKVQEQLRIAQEQRDEKFQKESRRLAGLLDRAQRLVEGPVVETSLSDVKRALDELQGNAGKVSAPVAALATLLATRWQSIRKAADDAIQIDIRFIRMVDAFRGPEGFDLQKYEEAMQDLQSATKNPSLASELKRAGDYLPLWKAVCDWNGVLKKPPPLGRKAFADFLKGAPPHPDLESIRQHTTYWDFEPGSLYREFEDIFKHPLVLDLYTVHKRDIFEKTVSKEKYFTTGKLLGDKMGGGESYRIHLILAPGHVVNPVGEPVYVQAKDTEQAPQSKLAEKILKLLESPRPAAPDDFAIELVSIVRDADSIHPIAHLDLLHKVVSAARAASPILRDLYQEHAASLDKLNAMLQLPWMNPLNYQTQQATPKVADARKKLPSFKNLTTKRDELLQKKNGALRDTVPLPIGFLSRAGAFWHVLPIARLKGEYQLFGAARDTDGSATWILLGTSSQGQVDLQASDLPEGTVVFARRAS